MRILNGKLILPTSGGPGGTTLLPRLAEGSEKTPFRVFLALGDGPDCGADIEAGVRHAIRSVGVALFVTTGYALGRVDPVPDIPPVISIVRRNWMLVEYLRGNIGCRLTHQLEGYGFVGGSTRSGGAQFAAQVFSGLVGLGPGIADRVLWPAGSLDL